MTQFLHDARLLLSISSMLTRIMASVALKKRKKKKEEGLASERGVQDLVTAQINTASLTPD